MPTSSPRLCPRCNRIVKGKCPCSVGWTTRKPTSWAGGSTRQWRKVRAEQLAEHPVCQWPDCPMLADQVDHIDGTDYATQRYEPAMLRSLCTPHHRERTAMQGHAARRGIPPG